MTYTPLHLKYRPQTFDELFGQEINAKIIQRMIVSNKVPNVFLLYGQYGGGKTSTARIIAKALNCVNPINGNPCNKCNTCIDITKDRYLDVVEIDAASNRGIAEAKVLSINSSYKPTYGKYKVYIIDEVQGLTPDAFRSLLKTLENPPSSVKFVLCTTEFYKIPETIKSRSMLFYFEPVTKMGMVAYLNSICAKENIELGCVVEEIADRTHSFRNALMLLEQCITLKDDSELLSMVLMRISKKEVESFINLILEQKAIEAIHYLKNLKFPVEEFLKEVSSYLCNVIENQTEYYSKLLLEKWIVFLKIVSTWRIEYVKSYTKDAVNDLNIFYLIKTLFGDDKMLLVSYAEKLAKKLDGYFKKTEEDHYLITTKKNNQLHLIADNGKKASGYYCYPDDAVKIINSNKPISELIKEGIIKKGV